MIKERIKQQHSAKMMINVVVALLLTMASSCDDKQNEIHQSECEGIVLNEHLGYQEILQGVDDTFLSQRVEQPNTEGALSRNKQGYFSVRFQMGMTKLADFAIVEHRVDALEYYLKTLQYAFAHQNADGSYQLNVPDELSIYTPTKGDSVSAVAFFGYELGKSLHVLEESDWYKTSPEASEINSQIDALLPNIEKTVLYLIDHHGVLEDVDAKAPNRLLFDAMAFYSLGKLTANQEAQDLARQFLLLTLELIHPEEGYFIEGGGWDSSYNGVAIMLGMELYSMLPSDDPLKESLGNGIICATVRQKSRIMDNGEISTEGNTRVYPGGESFLGNEKGVDVEKTIKAFYYFSRLTLTGRKAYKELARKVLGHYQ